ncbi:hypothetical protein [Roseibium sp.]|uniref:hypothetical protein n=1 Tax=Roseibium sp. TaxID=1936156 RepID=UPI003A97A93F
MADYYSILKKTIESLPENTGAARRSVYSRARNAIVNQLKSYEPPLSPSEITAEQLRLEEAIRKVEAEAARATLGLASKPAAPKADISAPVAPVASEPAKTHDVTAVREEPPMPPQGTDDDMLSAPEPEVAAPAPVEEPARATQWRSSESFSATKSKTDDTASTKGNSFGRQEPRVASYSSEETTAGRDEPSSSWGAGGITASRSSSLDSLDGMSEDEAAAPVKSEAESADTSRRRKRKPGKQSRASERLRSKSEKSSSFPIGLVGLLLLIVLGVGAVLYSQQDLINEMLAGSDDAVSDVETPVVASLPSDDSELDPPDAGEATEESGKIEDRLLDENGQPAVAPDARSVTTQPIRIGEGTGTPSSTVVGTAAPATTASGAGASDVSSEQDDVEGEASSEVNDPVASGLVAPLDEETAASVLPSDDDGGVERSILYEEGDANNGAGTASQGEVTWSVETDTDLEGRAQQVLTAQVVIPDRNVSVSMRIKPNDDTSLPASHLVELKYELPDDFTAGDVVNVPGLVMKPTEEARGDALIGASVKVSPGYFWIALSSIDSERDRNLALLRERAWIDIPMLYENGKRGILTLEKGAAGDAIIDQAITAWVGQ